MRKRPLVGHLASSLGAFLGLACLTAWSDSQPERVFLVGSFGATCVLVYGCPSSPLAQPRNVVGGHVLSALVGVLVASLPLPDWLRNCLAVALAMLVMEQTNTVHPPGGATALIATLGSPRVEALGFGFVLYPVGLGAVVLVATALLTNRLAGRAYPMPLMRASTTKPSVDSATGHPGAAEQGTGSDWTGSDLERPIFPAVAAQLGLDAPGSSEGQRAPREADRNVVAFRGLDAPAP